MKKIILILSFFLFPTFINAECSSEEIIKERNEVNKLAANVNVSSYYEIVGDTAKFNIKIANLDSKISISEKLKDVVINYAMDKINPREYTIYGYEPGYKVSFEIKAQNTNCINDQVITTKYASLPSYNKYYRDEICEGISDYYLCQRFAKVSSYESFKKTVEAYKKSLDNMPINDEVDNGDKFAIFNVIEKYYVPVLGSIILVGSVLIIREIRETKKSDFAF